MYYRRYETVVLVHPDAGDEGSDKVTQRFNESMASTGGKEIRLENWGTRKLAYELNRARRAHYLYFSYLGPNTTVAEFERLLGITEAVVKYQTIVLEDRIKLDAFDFDAARAEVTELGKKKSAPVAAPAQEVSA